jgi:hypothetical protein
MTKEQKQIYDRNWRKRNAEKVRESKRRWLANNREASAARRREYRKKNRERLDGQKRQWEKDNPDRVAASRALQRIRKAQGNLRRHLRWHYDVTIDDYFALVARQKAKCAICGATKAGGRWPRLHLDHDHKTGVVRGLLCVKCNSALGYFNDDPARLRRAADYLEGALYGQARLIPDGFGGRQGLAGVLGEVSQQGREEGGQASVGATEPISNHCSGDPVGVGLAN